MKIVLTRGKDERKDRKQGSNEKDIIMKSDIDLTTSVSKFLTVKVSFFLPFFFQELFDPDALGCLHQTLHLTLKFM